MFLNMYEKLGMTRISGPWQDMAEKTKARVWCYSIQNFMLRQRVIDSVL